MASSGSPLFCFRSFVTKIKNLRRNSGLPLPALLAKKFNCCVSYCIVEVGDYGVQISIFIYQCDKRCKSTTYSCLESTHHCWIIQLLDAKPDSWLGWFPWFCLESRHHYAIVASIICTWECSGSGSFWYPNLTHNYVFWHQGSGITTIHTTMTITQFWWQNMGSDCISFRSWLIFLLNTWMEPFLH